MRFIKTQRPLAWKLHELPFPSWLLRSCACKQTNYRQGFWRQAVSYLMEARQAQHILTHPTFALLRRGEEAKVGRRSRRRSRLLACLTALLQAARYFLSKNKNLSICSTESFIVVLLMLCLCFCAEFTFAQGVYKWTDEKGNTHYSSEAPSKNARPAQLPKITKAPFDPKRNAGQETCSTHGGINCQAGADADGSVICYDGFRDAANRFSLSCTEARLEIVEIKKKERVGEYAVFVRNQSGVEAKSPLLIYTFSRRQKREVPGPGTIAPFSSEELSLEIQPGESEPTQVTLQVTCANCP